MRHRCLALALLCALSVSPAFADEPAPEAAKIKWVMPWKAGTSLEYVTEQLETEDNAGVRSRSRATDKSRVRITQASKDGYLQVWTSEDPTYDVLEGDKSQEAFIRAATAGLSDLPAEVELNADGNYTKLRNIDTISSRLRTAMRPVVVVGVESELAKVEDPTKRAEARVEAMKRVDPMLETLFAPAVLEAMLARHLQAYNGFVGIELEPDQAYEIETELPNAVGGPGFPAKLTLSLSVSEDDPDDLFVTYDQVVDSKKAVDGVLALSEAMVGTKIDNTGKDAIDSVDIRDEGIFVVHRPTGVIEMFEATRTTKVGKNLKVERSRMRLTNGEHDHVWRDEEETAAAD